MYIIYIYVCIYLLIVITKVIVSSCLLLNLCKLKKLHKIYIYSRPVSNNEPIQTYLSMCVSMRAFVLSTPFWQQKLRYQLETEQKYWTQISIGIAYDHSTQ